MLKQSFSEKTQWAFSEDLQEAQVPSLLINDFHKSIWKKFLHTS